MPIRLYVTESDLSILKILMTTKAEDDPDPENAALRDRISQALRDLADPQREGYMKEAREQYVDDDINIDDDAAISKTEDGCWVGAFVFVRRESLPSYLKSTDERLHDEILSVAQDVLGGQPKAVFEHGQWWVILDNGAAYSVVDAEGPGSTEGLDFEIVKEADV